MSSTNVTIVVDGIQIEQDDGHLTAEDILQASRERGLIDGEAKDFDLKGLGPKGKIYAPDEIIDPSTTDKFITLPNGPTPVA